MATDEKQLASFVHISDLHIGSNTPAPLLWLWENTDTGALDGLLGHDYEACVRLEEFFTGRAANGEVGLIVTGDLTSWGEARQFQYARDYLGGESDLGNYDFLPIGLGVLDWRKRAIPGNHDHWPGKHWIVGLPSPELARSLSLCPTSNTVIPTLGQRVPPFLAFEY